jgi:hypothetical protein
MFNHDPTATNKMMGFGPNSSLFFGAVPSTISNSLSADFSCQRAFIAVSDIPIQEK